MPHLPPPYMGQQVGIDVKSKPNIRAIDYPVYEKFTALLPRIRQCVCVLKVQSAGCHCRCLTVWVYLTMSVRNLIQVGPFSCVVEYDADEGIYPAICRVFADVPRMVSTNALQRKDKEWGEFVDVGKDEVIPDRSVVRVVLDLLHTEEVGYSTFLQWFSIFYISRTILETISKALEQILEAA